MTLVPGSKVRQRLDDLEMFFITIRVSNIVDTTRKVAADSAPFSTRTCSAFRQPSGSVNTNLSSFVKSNLIAQGQHTADFPLFMPTSGNQERRRDSASGLGEGGELRSLPCVAVSPPALAAVFFRECEDIFDLGTIALTRLLTKAPDKRAGDLGSQ
jgi:hypothetical protein